MWYAIQNNQILYQGKRRYIVLHAIMTDTGGTKQKRSTVTRIVDSCYLYQYQSEKIYIGRRSGLEAIGFKYAEDQWKLAKPTAVSVPTMKTAFIVESGVVKGFEKDIPTAKKKVISLQMDTRKYPHFTKEENGLWRYVPMSPRKQKNVIYIATFKTFIKSEFCEIVDQYREMYRSLLIWRR